MNLKTIINIICLITALTFQSAAYSRETAVNQKKINLADKNPDFDILKQIYHSDSFCIDHFITEYTAAGITPVINPGDINLYSSAEKKDDRDMAMFTLESVNLLKQNFRFTWELPMKDASELFTEEPVSRLMDIASRCTDNDVNQVIQHEAVTSGMIKNFSVSYTDTGEGTQISGYNFSMRSVPSPTHRFWRTFSWMMLFNGLGVANYWINKDENMEDWKYKPNREDMVKKITDGWSFDTNAFRTNTVYHIYAGVIYYQVGRAGGYGYLESTMWAVFAGLVWEYIGEYREQVSANDMIFTTMGGVILGEAMTQCSIYLEKTLPDNVLRSFLTLCFDPARIVNRSIDNLMADEIDVNLQFINPAQALINKAGTDALLDTAIHSSIKNVSGSISLRW